MKIKFRGMPYEFPEGTTVEDVITKRGMAGVWGVWVNGRAVLVKDCPRHVLREGDVVRVRRIACVG